MNKKIKIISLIVLFLCIFVVIFIYTQQDVVDNNKEEQEISKEEQEFNDSGRAKAIEDETDLWQYYENNDAGFSLKYPHNVILGNKNMNESGNEYYLSINVNNVDFLEGTMGYNEETALKNIVFLEKGEYGEGVDFSLSNSEKVRNIGKVNAQEFAVLSRFEICNVVFEKKLYFFSNNYQVVITLYGPIKSFINNLSDYFTVNESNCGQEKIWSMENNKPEQFYKDLEDKKMPENVQAWYSTFNDIVNTIKFFED